MISYSGKGIAIGKDIIGWDFLESLRKEFRHETDDLLPQLQFRDHKQALGRAGLVFLQFLSVTVFLP